MSKSTEVTEEQQKTMVKNVFNTVADEYGLGGSRFFHLSGEAMAKLHGLNGNEHMLDIASGTGAAAIPLAKQLPQGKVSAVDFSEGMLQQAKQYADGQGLSNIQFHQEDMTAMPFEEASFDHANCAFGLFFIKDMTGLLRHFASKVKPGGNVMISGFCGDSFMPHAALALSRLKTYGIDTPEQPGWKRMAEPEQLQALFDEAGLKDMSINRQSLGYYTDAEGWWDVLWNAGFRGLFAQLDDNLDEFKRDHLAEVLENSDEKGVWLEIDVNFTQGIRPCE